MSRRKMAGIAVQVVFGLIAFVSSVHAGLDEGRWDEAIWWLLIAFFWAREIDRDLDKADRELTARNVTVNMPGAAPDWAAWQAARKGIR